MLVVSSDVCRQSIGAFRLAAATGPLAGLERPPPSRPEAAAVRRSRNGRRYSRLRWRPSRYGTTLPPPAGRVAATPLAGTEGAISPFFSRDGNGWDSGRLAR